jgi:hypothetical protein
VLSSVLIRGLPLRCLGAIGGSAVNLLFDLSPQSRGR